jgi:hypothetical protein
MRVEVVLFTPSYVWRIDGMDDLPDLHLAIVRYPRGHRAQK